MCRKIVMKWSARWKTSKQGEVEENVTHPRRWKLHLVLIIHICDWVLDEIRRHVWELWDENSANDNKKLLDWNFCNLNFELFAPEVFLFSCFHSHFWWRENHRTSMTVLMIICWEFLHFFSAYFQNICDTVSWNLEEALTTSSFSFIWLYFVQ
jgi:hypothetical protein